MTRARWRPTKARLRWRLYLLLLCTDVAMILLAHAAAGALRFGNVLDSYTIQLLVVTLPLYGVAAFVVNAYSVPVLLAGWESVRRGCKAYALALTATVFFFFLLQTGAQMSRFTFLAAALFGFIGIAIARWFVGKNASSILGGSAYDVIVIADGVSGYPRSGCTMFVDASGSVDPEHQSPANFARLGRLVGNADRVVIACEPERRLAWAAALQGANVQAEVIAPELAALRPLGIARHHDHPTIIVAQAPLLLRDRIIKRAFDIVVASLLMLLAAPVFLLIAIAVRRSSPGPVLFRQPRIGRRNQQFEILKFRSMRVETTDTEGHRSASRDDDRITPVGRVLRATSLDELPQLLNVLRGEMSMVGPRPHAVGSRAGEQLFWELDARYWHRHAIKPGLTGLAQVRGFRGATPEGIDLTNRLEADLEYRSDWSIWKDILILLRTAPVLLHRNAY
ncbi:exopolysaccharide biosynthesis polyprenyl glycosylphosphotransferase [Sphingomonas sp.]|uniref:exopolysaccharide biosynthesis polyprenyl glycosylphosphotransferase n=1 Tax=Sphingomonas sp. TaxID=28214 RepID=UPI002D80EC41|nr:exopolysaccharide biosynthesis polyprenyl glycosylphosphotransferase [Sphingomonas sp.]HEU0045287.1 exopolysaccharide biosynthesis polyprenyl glycosylphosphotransferase [Sphingomonas sp.]